MKSIHDFHHDPRFLSNPKLSFSLSQRIYSELHIPLEIGLPVLEKVQSKFAFNYSNLAQIAEQIDFDEQLESILTQEIEKHLVIGQI